uniref:Receptor ligand binding region domain-containing protein n=1 Tax=Anopheles maculatus TaxID=74869 RepID=A0A182TBW9_9DIPT
MNHYYHDTTLLPFATLPWKRSTTLWVFLVVLVVFAERTSSTAGDAEATLVRGTGIHYAALSGPSMAAEMLKAHPAGSFSVDDGSQPVFPERPDAVYFAVAVTGGAKLWGRTLARTLIDMGPPFGNPQGPPLRPIYINLPDSGRFSSKLMTTACDAIDGMPLAGMVIVGDSPAAKSLALAGNAMKVPVLWAKGGIASLHNSYDEVHWHSYHILCDVDTYVLISGKKGAPLRQKPLNPIIVTLPTNFDLIYKKLAYISRSTKGVVLVLCNLKVARLIMAEAQRMKMLNGHFVWLWMDTTSATEFYDSGQPSYESKQPLDVGVGGRSELETDFYDTFDMRHQSHLADLVERRMEFEDFDPRRKNRTRSYLDSQAARFGSAALVNPKPDGTTDSSSGNSKHSKTRRPAEKSKNGRGKVANNNNNTVVNVARRTERFDELTVDSDEFEDFDDERMLPLSGVNAEDEQYSIGGADSASELKLKRSSEYLKLHNTSGHVLFHHNQDFPVGLLALRPIKMKIDRHFIRAAVRLFAATWAKVERDDAPVAGKGRPTGRDGPGPTRGSTQDQSKVPRGQQRPVQMQQKRSATLVEEDPILTLPVNSANTQQSVHEASLLGQQQQQQQQRTVDEPSQTTPSQRPVHGTNDIISPKSNSSANLRDVSSTNSSRVKRQSTWWSATTNHKYNPDRGGSGGSDRSRGSRGGATRYKGGCMGTINRAEQAKAYNFAKNLQSNARQALSGFPIASGFIEKSLVSHFEMLNLVPIARQSSSTPKGDYSTGERVDGGRYASASVNGTAASGMGNTAATGTATKWRRVGLITGRS